MSPFLLVLPHIFRKNKTSTNMGFSTKKTDVLKVVHPRRYIEIFLQPITAGEIMRRYPRHCIARPDVFQFPWIVVRPESLLIPGQVFYLVPYSTLNKLLKSKKQQLQQDPSSTLHHNYQILQEKSPEKSSPGLTPKHKRGLHNNEEYYYDDQDSDTGTSSYKSEFYESWNKTRRRLDQSYDPACLGLDDSPFHTSSSCFSIIRSGTRPPSRVITPEQIEVPIPKSCLRRPDSDRKKMNLKVVTFAFPIVIPGSRRGSPSFH